MTLSGKEGPKPTGPSKNLAELRKQSVSVLHTTVENYARIARAPAHLQAQLLDQLHLEQSKYVTPYGTNQVPLPKEVAVENWSEWLITADEIKFNATELMVVVDLLTTAGAANSKFVQFLGGIAAQAVLHE